MYVGRYADAKPLLQEVIAGGKYGLVDNYHDNFDPATQNDKEILFAFKASVNDGAGESANGNWGDRLNAPHSSTVTECCGFHQPSQNLVNAFKTDASGLPLFATFNNADYDQAADNVDPRLDWTVGRVGIHTSIGDHSWPAGFVMRVIVEHSLPRRIFLQRVRKVLYQLQAAGNLFPVLLIFHLSDMQMIVMAESVKLR